MSHWAELDENNKVVRVLVGDNGDPAGDEGYQWLIDNFGGTWIKTSYNAATNGYRKNYAGVGYSYDATLDAFIPIKCHHEAILDRKTCDWVCPNTVHKEQ